MVEREVPKVLARDVSEFGRTPEDVAFEKIRDFLHDPSLKIHFTKTGNLRRILRQGVLSSGLARRIGQPIGESFGNPGERSIAIVDRQQNANPEYIDHWLRVFLDERDSVGLLLPNTIELRAGTMLPNESRVPRRIRPNQIDGLLLNTKDAPHLRQHFSEMMRADSFFDNASTTPVVMIDEANMFDARTPPHGVFAFLSIF